MKDLNRPKISIIVPVYNVEEYLPRCLDSLKNQTLRDIEIICVNDGSTDNSLEILMAYAKKDARINVIDKPNGGVSSARNCGLNIANGEYIGFVDPDDYVDITMYESMYNQAKKLDSEIVVCNSIRHNEWDNRHWKINYFCKPKSKTESIKVDAPVEQNIKKDVFLDTLLCVPSHAWNKIYKKEFLAKNKIKFPNFDCYEDCIFTVECYSKAENLSYIDKPFYFYMVRNNSTTRKLNTLHIMFSQMLNIIKKYLIENDLYEKLKFNFEYFSIMNFIWIYQRYDNTKELCKYVTKELSEENFQIFKNYLKLGKKQKILKGLRRCFSVENEDNNHKVFTICGIKLKLLRTNGQQYKERKIINKIKRNQNKYPKDCYLLFDCLNGDISESIDAYSLFKYMQSKGKNVYYVLLKNTEFYKKLLDNNDLKGIIPIENPMTTNSGDFFEAIYDILLRSKAVITAYGLFCSKYGQKFIKNNPYWQYIFIQHGQIFLKESVMKNGYLTSEKFDKILISSDYEYKIFKKYGWEDEKLIKCGLPRWDFLNQKNDKENSILIMLTWRKTNSLNFHNSLYLKNLTKLLKNNDLNKYLKKKHCKLYFAPHHSLLGLCGINIDFNMENLEIVDINNISEYIRKCSMLVTDWSSVTFDFMFQNKPVIHYILDKDDPLLNEQDEEDIRNFDYKKYIIPNVCYDESQVVQKIINYIENNFELEADVKEKYKQFFYTKTNIREQLTKEIDKCCLENKV